MSDKFSNNKDRSYNLIFLLLAEAFVVFSIIRCVLEGDWINSAWTVVSVFMLFIPVLAEHMLKQKLTLPVFILGLLYSLGPSLGHTYNLYNLFPWWDELLHFTGGVVFTLLGFELARKLGKGKLSDINIWLIALFGVFFSVTLSVVWEFAEYGADMFFGLDMQNDTVIHSITSYMLGPEPGTTGRIENIEEVIVNGNALNIGGYLDIGLNDTMTDLLTEALGSVISLICFAASKGKISIFRGQERS